MSWILLLLQLLPSIIELVKMILDALNKVPKAQRAGFKAELKTTMRKARFGDRRRLGSRLKDLLERVEKAQI